MLNCIGLFSQVINPQLRYVVSNKSMNDLEISDFAESMSNKEIIYLNDCNLYVLLSFEKDIMISSLRMYINNSRFTGLDDYFKFKDNNKFAIELSSFIVDDGLLFEMEYLNPSGPIEGKSWEFEVGKNKTELQKVVSNTKFSNNKLKSENSVSADLNKNIPFKVLKDDDQGWIKYFAVSPDGRLVAYIFEEKNKTGLRILNLTNDKVYSDA